MTSMKKITHQGDEVEDFFEAYLKQDGRKILFIGTVGFNDAGNYFPIALASCPQIDYKFFVEEREVVPSLLLQAGAINRASLETSLSSHSIEFVQLQIVSGDTAVVGGRNAVKAAAGWLNSGYTDIVIDATSMSRGVCFPVALQAIRFSQKHGLQPHLLVAERHLLGLRMNTMSSDVACYMHGFQTDMDTDDLSNALTMWVPQLSESAAPSLERIFSTLKPQEVVPVLPFPAATPRRADELLIGFREQLTQTWEVNLIDTIYADESNPMDVYETIRRLHVGRDEIFKKATNTPTRTVLSPSGWRVGSIGMLLAALELDLPVMYTENIGYTVLGGELPPPNPAAPTCRWHIWLLTGR